MKRAAITGKRELSAMLTIAQQVIHNDKNYNKPEATASQFPAGVPGNYCSEPIPHIVFFG